MSNDDKKTEKALFAALLRYWRQRRGLSQLELSLEADVSARHLSFLESNRAKPSEEMVLRLLAVLAVPLREQNEALVAAGFAPHFLATPDIPEEIDHALDQMMTQHEPYPISAVTIDGTIVRANRGTEQLFSRLLPAGAPGAPNIYDLFFDPRLLRPFVIDWEDFARGLLLRLQRERLIRGDARLTSVLERLFTFPEVPRAWKEPDLGKPVPPTLQMGFFRPAVVEGERDFRVRFLVTATTFYSPTHVALDELRVESCFPLDEETRATCAAASRS